MPADAVRDYYDAEGEEEWRRLAKDSYHRLEYLTHLHFMEVFLPPSGAVLDVGGGPGRYAIALAQRGFRVVLIDPSAVQRGIARRKIAETGIPARSVEIAEGALPDLAGFPAETFDAVLCFGALSHLTDTARREKAVDELVRVAKRGAPLFISVIGRYGMYRTLLQRTELHERLTDPDFQETLVGGVHHLRPGRGPDRFPDAYFFRPEELRPLLESRGLEVLLVAACEGLAAHLQAPLEALARDPERWDRWMEIHWRTCTDPTVLGAAEHILAVGRKR